MKATVIDHPLVQHKLTLMRMKETSTGQFRRLLNLARLHGAAVAIGHPRPTTLAFLEQALPTLEQEGIELVPVKAVIRGQQILAAQ